MWICPMPRLAPMPPVEIAASLLLPFGQRWTTRGGNLSRTPPQSSGELGRVFDSVVADALAVMLGSVPILAPNPNSLVPVHPNCVELGPVRVVGGVRPQNFDVGYRPDGIRFAFDSKTLNDAKSVGKNWQNMVNDLATEATTVHSRFPHALVTFIVAIPIPSALPAQRTALIETLERLGRRSGSSEPVHMAEAVALVLWDPETGRVNPDLPAPSSPIRIEKFAAAIEAVYATRYKGLPPHATD